MDSIMTTPIAIIGAGPIGLALAAKLSKSKTDFILLEKGKSVGANILEWGQVELFSTWENSVDKDAQTILEKNRVALPQLSQFPTGAALVNQYLQPLANTPQLVTKIKIDSEVHSIFYNDKKEASYFDIDFTQHGISKNIKAKIVIDASGTWGNFNPIIASKITNKNIFYGIPDTSNEMAKTYSNKAVAVVGNGHSAMNSLQALAKLELQKLTWIIRGDEPKFGKSKVGGQSRGLEENIQTLINQGRITLRNNFTIKEIEEVDGRLNLRNETETAITALDKLVVNIGFYPNHSIVSNFDLQLDSLYGCPKNLSDKINPKLHSCSTVSYHFSDLKIADCDYYVVGMKSFGKASNFLLSSGYKILDGLVAHFVGELVQKKS